MHLTGIASLRITATTLPRVEFIGSTWQGGESTTHRLFLIVGTCRRYYNFSLPTLGLDNAKRILNSVS
jgi:hypothetical protein